MGARNGGHSDEIKGAGCQVQSLGDWRPLPGDRDECAGSQPWLKGKPETAPLEEDRWILGEAEVTAKTEEPGWG